MKTILEGETISHRSPVRINDVAVNFGTIYGSAESPAPEKTVLNDPENEVLVHVTYVAATTIGDTTYPAGSAARDLQGSSLESFNAYLDANQQDPCASIAYGLAGDPKGIEYKMRVEFIRRVGGLPEPRAMADHKFTVYK